MIERVSFGGLPNCYRIANGTVEAIVSIDVGPRILRYAFVGGETWQLIPEIDLGPSDDTAQAAIQNAFTRCRGIESSVV